MKFIDTYEPVTKVWLDEEDGKEVICLEIDNHVTISLTPLEAQQFAELLQKKCTKTEYFRGLKKPSERTPLTCTCVTSYD